MLCVLLKISGLPLMPSWFYLFSQAVSGANIPLVLLVCVCGMWKPHLAFPAAQVLFIATVPVCLCTGTRFSPIYLICVVALHHAFLRAVCFHGFTDHKRGLACWKLRQLLSHGYGHFIGTTWWRPVFCFLFSLFFPFFGIILLYPFWLKSRVTIYGLVSSLPTTATTTQLYFCSHLP